MKERLKRFVRIVWLGYLFLRRPQKAFNLIALMRGPDFEKRGESLKFVFTQRLRSFFFSRGFVPFMRREPLTWNDVLRLLRELKRLGGQVRGHEVIGVEIHHYLHHVETATLALKSLPLQSEEEKREIQALCALGELITGESPFFERVTVGLLSKWYGKYFEKE